MTEKSVYLKDIFLAAPRLLHLLNKTPLSKTYGSFHRAHWHYKTFDFPSSITQMGVHSLALLYSLDHKDNIYYKSEAIKEWAIASFKYSLSLQKSDGSFDEWYPNERGWAGPTGYLIHALYESFQIFEKELSSDLISEFKEKARKSAYYLLKNEESDVLANHHAIALLPIYEVYLLTGDKDILAGYEKSFENFKIHWNSKEGWFLEYDGVDIGYLAATISFLARLHNINPEKEIEIMVEKAISFVSYHCYPDYSFGGAIGCRQTQHFYPFGFEYWSSYFPLSASIAEWGRQGLEQRRHVSVLDQSDHYIFYRFPEYIEAFSLNSKSCDEVLMPSAREDFTQYFTDAAVYVQKKKNTYIVANLRRGGVVKVFSTIDKSEIFSDSGWIGQDSSGKLMTAQWSSSEYDIKVEDEELVVSGDACYVFDKVFTPWSWISFRLFMLLGGFNAKLAKFLKYMIRKFLIIKAHKAPLSFQRKISILSDAVQVEDEIVESKSGILRSLFSGGEHFVRYVPQSRYFLPNQLENLGREIDVEKSRCSKGKIQILQSVEIN